MVRNKILYAVLLCLPLIGCSSIDVNSDYDTKADFDQLQNFQWVDNIRTPDQQSQQQHKVENPLLISRIRDSVIDELTIKGFTEGDSPDFYIGCHALTEQRMSTVEFTDYYGPGPYSYYGVPGMSVTRNQNYYYERGTLVLDIVDAKTSQLIWRGTAQGHVQEYSDTDARIKRINDAVHKVLKKFPPK